MGCTGSKLVEVNAKAERTEPPSLMALGPHGQHISEESSRHSIVGSLMSTHVHTGSVSIAEQSSTDTLRIQDVYDFNNMSVLGSGMNGEVRSIRHRFNDKEYAMKMYPYQEESDLDELRAEIGAMRRLDHPNIVRIVEAYEDLENGIITLVLELCTGGTLQAKMKDEARKQKGWSMHEAEAMRLITQMLSALAHCHSHGVVHRDLKLDNFVFETPGEGADIKMIDFGLSRILESSEQLMESFCGTLLYIAPEMFKHKRYTSACDMWSMGVIAYHLLTGYPPFWGATKVSGRW